MNILIIQFLPKMLGSLGLLCQGPSAGAGRARGLWAGRMWWAGTGLRIPVPASHAAGCQVTLGLVVGSDGGRGASSLPAPAVSAASAASLPARAVPLTRRSYHVSSASFPDTPNPFSHPPCPPQPGHLSPPMPVPTSPARLSNGTSAPSLPPMMSPPASPGPRHLLAPALLPPAAVRG